MAEVLTKVVQTLTFPNKDTEQTFTLPNNVKRLTVKHRGGTAAAVITRIATETAKVQPQAEPFYTIEGGQVENFGEGDVVLANGQKLFIATDTDNVVVEFVIHTGP